MQRNTERVDVLSMVNECAFDKVVVSVECRGAMLILWELVRNGKKLGSGAHSRVHTPCTLTFTRHAFRRTVSPR